MSTSIRDQLRKTLAEEIAPAFRVTVPYQQQRQTIDGIGSQAELPEGLKTTRGELAGLTTEWLVAPGASTDHALLHLHGGGYVVGSCTSHRGLASWIGASVGVQVVLPEYRLAPEHPFPAPLDDAVAAYRALLDTGLSPERIVLSGDSAGGGLALSTLMALRDGGHPLPAAALLLSPWTDMTLAGESMQTRAAIEPWLDQELLAEFATFSRGEFALDDPRVSPLFGDLSGLPPLLVQVGDQEILLSDSLRLRKRAAAAGAHLSMEVGDELWHVYQLFAPALPDANEALERAGTWVRGRLGIG